MAQKKATVEKGKKVRKDTKVVDAQAAFDAELAKFGGKRGRMMAAHLKPLQSAVLTQAQLDDVEEMFTYHAPTPAQIENLKAVRRAAKDLAATLVVSTPRCADQTAAVRLLRECVMTANAAIVLEGRLS